MKKVLITGGSGFIGRNISESYLKDTYQLLAPSRKILDLTNDLSVESFFKQHEFDVVVHCATKPAHRNVANMDNIVSSNTRMFFNLLKYSDRFEKLIWMGSGSVYDANKYLPKMKEDYFGVHIPGNEHAFSKYICSKASELKDNIYDLRIFGMYGKYEDYAIRFISNAICKSIFNLPITIHQNRKLDYVFIDDFFPILEYFIENEAQHKAYNITPDHTLDLLSIAQLVKKITNNPHSVKVHNDGIGMEYTGDNARLKSEIKNSSFTSLEQGIEKLYHWYLNQKSAIDQKLLLTDK